MLSRPRLDAIVASVDLATALAANPATRPDGYVVKGYTAGGHNAPPRGPRRVDQRGQPRYHERGRADQGKPPTAFKTATAVGRVSGGMACRGAAMLTGMTAPPGGPDENTIRERLRRSGEAGDRAGEGAEPVDEGEARSQELHTDHQADDDGMGTVHGSTPEQVHRAAQLENRSYRHMQQARHEAAKAHDRAAEAHGRAAQLHDRQADLGWGNVDEHREQAHAHREHEEADRAEADQDRDAYRDDSSDQPRRPDTR